MKKLLAVLLLATVLLCAGCSKKGEYDPPSGYKLASNEDADYCLFVPDKWVLDLSTAAAGAYFSDSDPSSVSVMAWETEHYDTTLDDWWATNKNDLELVFRDFELLSEENTTLDGLYAKKYVYNATLGANSYRFTQVAAIRKSSVYVFTYSTIAPVDNVEDAHAEAVENILSFFRFKS